MPRETMRDKSCPTIQEKLFAVNSMYARHLLVGALISTTWNTLRSAATVGTSSKWKNEYEENTSTDF